MHPRTALPLLTTLLLVTLLTACRPQAIASAPTVPDKPSITLQPCTIGGRSAQCGTLWVYEDRLSRTGRIIGLRVAVVKAQSEHPQPDPVFYLEGGPGVAATEHGLSQVSPSLRNDRDLVLVDQRGTGGSNRVVPPDAWDFSGPFQSAFERRIKSWFANPQINQQMDPRFYTTSLAMDDLDDVRQALGYDKINVAGGSYGTTAAQYYLRQHEAHVRSLILVNGSLLDIPVFERWSLSGQLALDRVFDLCLADAACKAAFPNIRQEFKDLWARMAEEPVTIGFSDKSLGTATLTPRYMGAVLRLMLKDAKNDGRVPLLIHRAYAENDWQGFAQFIESNSNIEWWGPQIMEHVIRCGEKWARFDPAEVARLGKGTYALDYDLWLAQQQVDVCALTPRGVMPEGDSPQPRSNVPVLIFSSALDSIDPPENVAGADKVFPNSLSVVMPYQSHNISDYNTGYCLFSLEQQFIQSGSVQGLDASCLANIRPPVFETR